jgi:nucleoside-diphosphate-sugar epimerase
VVTGATGNIGSSLVPRLVAAGADVVGVARHAPPPDGSAPDADRVTWRSADVGVDDLGSAMAGARAVVHLAWAIQPSHDPRGLFRTNVVGTERVLRSALAAGVDQIVHASSIGAYSPAPRGTVVDETWPTDGTPELGYSWQKADVERRLDVVEAANPHVAIARLRPALVFQRLAAARIHRLFVGPLLPTATGVLLAEGVRRAPIGVQVVHADDVADAVVRILQRRATGAFNLAAEPRLGHERRGGRSAVRGLARLAALTWRTRLVAAEPGWLRLAADVPTMSTERAHDVLGWQPAWTSDRVVDELAAGMRSPEGRRVPER